MKPRPQPMPASCALIGDAVVVAGVLRRIDAVEELPINRLELQFTDGSARVLSRDAVVGVVPAENDGVAS